MIQIDQTHRNTRNGRPIDKRIKRDARCGTHLTFYLKIITIQEEPPDDQRKKTQTQKINNTVNNGLDTLGQEWYEKFHLDMKADEQRGTCRESHGHQLSQHHQVKGPKDRKQKKLAPEDINSCEQHHKNYGSKPHPFNPHAELAIESVKLL